MEKKGREALIVVVGRKIKAKRNSSLKTSSDSQSLDNHLLSLSHPDAESTMSARPGFLPPPASSSAYNPNLPFRPPPQYNAQPTGLTTPRTYLPPPSLNSTPIRAGPTPQQIQAYQLQLQAQQQAQNAVANNAYQNASSSTRESRASRKDRDKGPGPFSTSRTSLVHPQRALLNDEKRGKEERSHRPFARLLLRFHPVLINLVKSMMYGFGDDPDPAEDAVSVMEDLFGQFVTELVCPILCPGTSLPSHTSV
jgi:hypothetical protein